MYERAPQTAESLAPSEPAPPAPLRILLLEDDPADAALIEETLVGGGLACEVRRAASREAFEVALRDERFDVVLSDLTLPAYDGMSALGCVRGAHQDLPFIFVSGTIGEEAAIASLLAGATDYVLKDRLTRLCPAVRRALREAGERHARQRAEEERRRLEERLRQAQKLEVVGQLAGGIAHDFNNLLVVINSYVDLALQELPLVDRLRPDLEEVRKAGARAAALTRQLLAFSRNQILQPALLDVNDVVQNLERMLRRLIAENVELQVTLGADAGTVWADPAQLELVLMNLVLNARDAMPQGGRIAVETGATRVDAPRVTASGEITPGLYVTLTVSDTGCGMDPETLAHALEPFFTTKPPGRGTGLGLSTAYGVVGQSGGHLEMESAVGKGTTVRVMLPRAEAAPAEPAVPAGPTRKERPAGGHETVLIVEDSEGVRQLAERVLRHAGYQVVVAATGEEALERCATTAVDLLLTDVVLPGMNGAELGTRVHARFPRLAVLYMSGYLGKAGLGPSGPAIPYVSYIQKPFTAGELEKRVRGALDLGR